MLIVSGKKAGVFTGDVIHKCFSNSVISFARKVAVPTGSYVLG